MDLSKINMEAFKACCRAYGVKTIEGRGGVTVGGVRMDAKSIFSLLPQDENYTAAIKAPYVAASNCILEGNSTDNYKVAIAKTALLAA